MSELLILCVDRDNDVGEKANIETPVVGRDAVFDAAVRLAFADPEDSDLNAMFESLRIYNEMRRRHQDAEIALIAGDINVGIISDMKIAEQTDQVMGITGAKKVILVTDGTEDEEIVPIIQSRMTIDAVRRVIVKQSKPLESGFYMIRRLFEEKRFIRSFMPLMGLMMLAFSISIFFGYSELIIGGIIGIIGFYMLLKGLGLEQVAIDLIHSLKTSLYSGKLTFITYICAAILLVAGTFQGALASSEIQISDVLFKEFENIILITVFVKSALWWYVCACIAPLIGKIINMMLEGEQIVRQWTVLFSTVASGILIYGGSECLLAISGVEGNPWAGYQMLFFSIIGAIILYLIGVRIAEYARTLYERDNPQHNKERG